MNSKMGYLLLLLAMLLQVTIFNHISIFGVKLNILFVIFILTAFYFHRSYIILTGAIIGWFGALASTMSPVNGALLGGVIGLVLYALVGSSYWSLTWVRVALCSMILLLVEVVVMLVEQIQFSPVALALLAMFILVHSAASLILTQCIGEPAYE